MERKPYRSFFWPVVLIGAGVIWLLAVMGVIPSQNFAFIGSLWPLILIVIGLDILVGRRSSVAGFLIGLGAIAVVVAALVAGPALGLPKTGMLQNRILTEPLNGATSADISLNLASQPVYISTVAEPANLFEGNLDYYGSLHYNASGNPRRRISLSSQSDGLNFSFDSTARWEIGLSPQVPLDLSIEGGSGSSEVDLEGMQLTSFGFDMGSGSSDIRLPAGKDRYTVRLDGGSGSLNVSMPVQTNLTMNINSGSGSIDLNVPTDAAVRLEVRDSGSGSVNVPDRIGRVSGNNKEGVWQTEGFDQAVHQIIIICDHLGSGSFNID